MNEIVKLKHQNILLIWVTRVKKMWALYRRPSNVTISKSFEENQLNRLVAVWFWFCSRLAAATKEYFSHFLWSAAAVKEYFTTFSDWKNVFLHFCSINERFFRFRSLVPGTEECFSMFKCPAKSDFFRIRQSAFCFCFYFQFKTASGDEILIFDTRPTNMISGITLAMFQWYNAIRQPDSYCLEQIMILMNFGKKNHLSMILVVYKLVFYRIRECFMPIVSCDTLYTNQYMRASTVFPPSHSMNLSEFIDLSWICFVVVVVRGVRMVSTSVFYY